MIDKIMKSRLPSRREEQTLHLRRHQRHDHHDDEGGQLFRKLCCRRQSLKTMTTDTPIKNKRKISLAQPHNTTEAVGCGERQYTDVKCLDIERWRLHLLRLGFVASCCHAFTGSWFDHKPTPPKYLATEYFDYKLGCPVGKESELEIAKNLVTVQARAQTLAKNKQLVWSDLVTNQPYPYYLNWFLPQIHYKYSSLQVEPFKSGK
jgi:hypothetical protein